MNKLLNMCIDYSNICFRSMYTAKYGSDGAIISNFSTKEECEVFARKVFRDISYILRMFKPDNVYILVDSPNAWRKSVCANYKGTRKRDDSIDMKKIFDTMNDIIDILSNKGFRIVKIDKAEADDIACLFKESKQDNESILFITSDSDWHQLIEFNEKNESFVAVYNPLNSRKYMHNIFVTRECSLWLRKTAVSNDIFNISSNEPKNRINSAISSERGVQLVDVEPMNVLLDKIMCGDDGDNVPSFFEFYNGGRKVRISGRRYEKIRDLCGFDDVQSLCECAKSGKLKENIEVIMKTPVDTFDINERLELQRKCVELSSEIIPEDINAKFATLDAQFRTLGTRIDKSSLKIETLLEGTKYAEKGVVNKDTKYNDVFSDFIKNTYNTKNDIF
jgi:hypothetical protein